MNWRQTYRADPLAARIADQHYSRQRHGSRQYAPPGRLLALVTADYSALWCTSFPYPQFVRHQWAGAFMCSLFRNESSIPSSELIREAVALTRGYYGEPPALGMVTFVDPRKVPGFFVRTPEGRELRWGYSFWKAGFRFCGWTKGGLYALQLLPDEMPEPLDVPRAQRGLFEAA